MDEVIKPATGKSIFRYSAIDCCFCGGWGAVSAHYGPWWVSALAIVAYVIGLPIVSALTGLALDRIKDQSHGGEAGS